MVSYFNLLITYDVDRLFMCLFAIDISSLSCVCVGVGVGVGVHVCVC